MKKLSTFLFAVVVAMVWAVDPYPYPQPKPTNGSAPNKVIGLNQAVGPGAYDQLSPAVWDTDIGGGLQSRTNQIDRLATKWMRLGAIVMDQTDRTYYGVDVLPGTTNLSPWRPLFSLDGGSAFDESIYSTNGVIQDFRDVNLNSKWLTFGGPGSFIVASSISSVDAGTNTVSGDKLNLLARNGFTLQTPGTRNNTVTNGWVLTLLDRATGMAEYVAPSGIDTNGVVPPDTSIYLNDGVVLADRTVSLAGHNLAFNGGGSGQVFFTNSVGVNIGGTTVKLMPLQSLNFSTAMSRSNLVSVGDVLKINGVSPGAFVTADFGAPTVVKTIYSADDALAGDRLVNGANHDLSFSGVKSFNVDAENTVIGANATMNILTPLVNQGTAPTGGVLTMLDAFGTVEFRTPTAVTNIYNSNGTLATNRTVFGDGKNLTFSGVNALAFTSTSLSAIAPTLDLTGSTRLGLKTPSLTSANPGYILTLLDKTTGASEWSPFQNLYTIDGALTADRSVNGSSRFLKITNVTTLDLLGQNTALSGSLSLYVRTPNINGGTATNNQVLTLIDKNTGRAEYVTLPAFPTIPPDTSIYNTSGTLTADRTVSGAAQRLTFTNLSLFEVRGALTNTIGAVSELNIKTPAVANFTAAAGQVLKLVTTNGAVEFSNDISTNLYNSDGTLGANRTVQGAAKDLSITNVGNLWLQATNIHLVTPAVKAGSASLGHVLSLVSTNGGVEFAPPSGGGGADGSIYLNDGSLTTNRIVNQAGKTLDFTATGTRFAVNGATNLNLNGVDANLNFIGTLKQTAAGKYQLETPRVVSLGATALTNQVLTMAADGSADFQPFTPTGLDTSIYNGSGTLIGNTTVTMGNKSLTFNGTQSFLVSNPTTVTIEGVNTTLKGSTKLMLQTPANGAAADGQVLTRMASDGSSEWQAIPSAVNIYNTSGSLTTDRTVTLAGKQLTFTGSATEWFQIYNPRTFSVLSKTNTQTATEEFTFGSPAILKLSAPSMNGSANGKVLTVVNGTLGTVDVQTPVNLYSANGTLATPRTVSQNGNFLKVNGPGEVQFNPSGSDFSVNGANSVSLDGATAVTLRSIGSLKLQTPKTTSALKPSVGDVLTFQSVDGTSEFAPPNNLYTTSGILTGTRLVQGAANNLTFEWINQLKLDALTNIIKGDTAVKIVTPAVTGGGASSGYILTLMDTTGKAEWLPNFSPVTLYTGNGTLAANRTVTMNGKNLTFTGPGAWTAALVGGSFNVSANSVGLISSGTLTLEAPPAGGEMKIRTPLVTGAGFTTPAVGSVLTLQNVNGLVEFATPPSGVNIYNASGTVTTDRTVNGNGHSMTFNNNSTFTAGGTSLEISATSQMRVKAPGYQSAPVRSVLRLLDPATGRVGYEPEDVGIGDGNVIEYHATLTGTMVGSTVYLMASSVTPTPPVDTIPPKGTRMIGKITSGVNLITSGGPTYLYWPNASAPDGCGVFPPLGPNLSDGTLENGLYVELVFDPNKNPSESNLYRKGGWVMLNTGWSSTTHPPMALMSPQMALRSPSPVTTVTYAGVVDTANQLADAPVSFKKISALGIVAAGDGLHADYFLTAYDATVEPRLIVRSNVDTNKMWKQLVAR